MGSKFEVLKTEEKALDMLSLAFSCYLDGQKNACHGSDSPVSAASELEFFFPSSGAVRQNTATFKDSTCCVIKPHAVASRKYSLFTGTLKIPFRFESRTY